MITVEQAKMLRPGQTIWELGAYNYDGTARRWYVNGKVQTWKRDPNKFRVPLKHGLYNYGELTQYNAKSFSITEPPRLTPEQTRILKAGGRVSGVTIVSEPAPSAMMKAKSKSKIGKSILDRALEAAGVKNLQNR